MSTAWVSGRPRTGNHFMYLTGIEAWNAFLVLLPQGDADGVQEILFVRSDAVFSEKPDEEGRYAAMEARTGLERVYDLSAMWPMLQSRLQAADVVLLNGPDDGWGLLRWDKLIKRFGAKEDAPRTSILEVVAGADEVIHELRFLKSTGEIANLAAAVGATARGHQYALKAIRPGATELDVEGMALAGFRCAGAIREAFPCMIGTGANACEPHHIATTDPLKDGDLVVVDIGAEYNYYAADTTRTYPCNGRFNDRQRELYELVLATQRACEEHFTCGITLSKLQEVANRCLRESPLRAKQGDAEKTLDNFKHGTGIGHSIGLDVHDDLSAVTRPLTAGAAFTLEPGVYIEAEGIGIRIEDCYYVDTDGTLVKLSAGIPSDIETIESLMRPKSN